MLYSLQKCSGKVVYLDTFCTKAVNSTRNKSLFIDNIMTYLFIQEVRGQIGTATKPAVFGSFCIGHFKIAVVEMNGRNMGVPLK